MKKRVFITALIAALVLSFSASAWAAGRGGYTIDSMTTAYKTVNSSTDRTGDFAQIVVRVNLYNYASGDAATGNYATSADTLTWSLETRSGTLVRAKIVSVDKYEALTTVDISKQATGTSTVPYRAKLAGTISGDAVIRVIATLSGTSMKANNGVITKSVDITFSSKDADAYGEKTTDDDKNASSFKDDTKETHDERDPESREWNGLKMPYTMTPGTAAAGVKPKITWAKPSDFKAGTEATVVATITGPVEEINAYVAAKDAVKLYGIDKNSAVDIPLTSANVYAYNIPFRVTVIDDSKNVATGEKNDDKSATTKVTLAFNGGKFSMKGFPITLSATNSNSSGKATVKAVKLNVTPNTDTPEWVTYTGSFVWSEDTTGYVEFPSITAYNTWKSAHPGYTGSTDVDPNPRIDDSKYVRLEKAPVTYYYDDNGNLLRYGFEDVYESKDFASALGTTDYANWGYNNCEVKQRGKYWCAEVPTLLTFVSNDAKKANDGKWVPSGAFTSFDKKAKPEITATVYPNGKPDSADDKGGEFGEEYFLKGTAPLLIATPKAPKDGGISIDVTRPKFDYLGNNIVSGCVGIFGTLEKTDKETKNAIALTASNPSTKKKAALKTTVIGKTVPVFDKTTTFKFDTSVLNADYDLYLIDSDFYSADREKVANKRVAAPKLPKPKFKAKGSKTITYKLGLWTADGDYLAADGESAYAYLRSKFTGDLALWHYMYGNVGVTWSYEDFGEEFNADLADQLAAKNMSFDAKKGSIVALSKTAKDTSPTLNEAGDYFASMDLPVTAVNSAGAAQAWTELGITGDKGKVADKSLVLSGAVKKGDVFKFKLLAGKTKAESVTTEGGAINIRSYTAAAADATVLSDWGLELVNYDSMDILVSAEVSVAAGTKLPDNFKSADVVSGNARHGVNDTTESKDKLYAANAMVIRSGSKWVRSKDISCINYGLVQVADPAKLAKVIADAKSADKADKELKTLEKGKKVNLLLDNLGMVTKGKITIGLKKDITNAGNPATTTNGALPASNGAALVKAAPEAAKKPGTAGDYVPNNGALPEEAEEAEAEENVTVTIGAPRTVENLTAGQKAFLTEKGYKVIAVLPEISANAEGQQKFDVKLDEDAPEGAVMVYIAFPKNAQPSEDDNIADFYDADGEPIEDNKVPAEKDITVEPWLRENVTYEPVIAVEE